MITHRQHSLNATFSKLLKDYENWLISKRKADSTIDGFVSQISRCLEWLQDDMKIDNIKKINSSIMMKYENHIQNRTSTKSILKDSNIYTRLVEVRNFGKFLKARGHLRFNPCIEIELPVRNQKKKELSNIPNIDDINSMQQLIDTKKILGQRDYIAIQMLAKLGLRSFELRKATWDDIDFVDETIFVIGKDGSEDYLPLDKKLIEALKYYKNEIHPKIYKGKRNAPKSDRKPNRNLIFPSKTGLKMTSDNLNVLVKGYAKKAMLKRKFTPKDIRDFFINTLVNKGLPIKDVSALARHEDIQTTYKWYIAKSDTKKLREALEKSNPFFELDSEGLYND